MSSAAVLLSSLRVKVYCHAFPPSIHRETTFVTSSLLPRTINPSQNMIYVFLKERICSLTFKIPNEKAKQKTELLPLKMSSFTSIWLLVPTTSLRAQTRTSTCDISKLLYYLKMIINLFALITAKTLLCFWLF